MRSTKLNISIQASLEGLLLPLLPYSPSSPSSPAPPPPLLLLLFFLPCSSPCSPPVFFPPAAPPTAPPQFLLFLPLSLLMIPLYFLVSLTPKLTQ